MSENATLLRDEFKLSHDQVRNTLALFDDAATIPFIARYRKEATGGLDETVLRGLRDRYGYLEDLVSRKETILKSINEQNKLTPALQIAITACFDKTKLEDLYLPYKPKRKTRASVARERGLEPLLEALLVRHKELSQEALVTCAETYVSKEVESAELALKGASDIYAERVAERAENRALVRDVLHRDGLFHSRAKRGKEDEKSKFEMYYNFTAPVKKISSHNYLALRRGERDGFLSFDIEADDASIIEQLHAREILFAACPVAEFLKRSISDAYQRLLRIAMNAEIRLIKKRDAESVAIDNFEKNLRNLLLAAPAGNATVFGVDPGFRSGCKIAVIDGANRFVKALAVFPNAPQNDTIGATKKVGALLDAYQPKFIAIGNGTASRETEHFFKTIMRERSGEKPVVLVVSEAGASVYSASESAIREFPDEDVTVRGAVSIGRRLMDPLAELVKIDPKAIGVGQYQHDVDQKRLKDGLEDVVESCVNYVGVDVNNASTELLNYVSGINKTIAQNIINYRNKNGAFKNRQALLNVDRVGAKVFEQSAGFLRIKEGDMPLDNTAVHPETYPLVEAILQKTGLTLVGLLKDPQRLDSTLAGTLEGDRYTIDDVFDELRKPGRDPRQKFEYATFRDDVTELKDLNEGMWLEGVVTNVTNFGAFVDIGVHQDGLIHVSQLADRFVSDPTTIVKVGERTRVRVVSIDHERKRIGLSRRTQDEVKAPVKGNGAKPVSKQNQRPRKSAKGAMQKQAAKNNSGFSLDDLMNKFK